MVNIEIKTIMALFGVLNAMGKQLKIQIHVTAKRGVLTLAGSSMFNTQSFNKYPPCLFSLKTRNSLTNFSEIKTKIKREIHTPRYTLFDHNVLHSFFIG